MQDTIPRSLTRRLLLALLGWRCLDGVWCGPGPCLTEEELDRMSARQWRAFVQAWRTSATATN